MNPALSPAKSRTPHGPLRVSWGACALGLAWVMAGWGCAKAVDPGEEGRRCVTWKEDVSPVLAGSCLGCHSQPTPQGEYDLSSYLGALGERRSKAPVATVGDAQSRLLTRLQDAPTGDPHHGQGEVLKLLTRWVMECRLSYFKNPVHEAGLINPQDPSQFHGAILRQSGWDFAHCTKCHGEDFGGGRAGKACTACHEQGPLSCTTCHRGDPQSGAHVVHRNAPTTHKQVDCTDCHRLPTRFTDPGHVFDADGGVLQRPTVVLGARAWWKFDGGTAAPPNFNGTGCSNIYCHGGTLADPAAGNAAPTWTTPPPTGTACTSCHGFPPLSHGLPPATDCSKCHGRVVQNGVLISTALHLDGVVDLGDGSQGCTACHAAPDSTMFFDTQHSTDKTKITVGLHDAHLHPRFGLSAPALCSDCHRVPGASLRGHPGHPAPARVFPAGGTGKAFLDGAQPFFDGNAATCSNVYCHGGGQKLLADNSPTIVRLQNWLDLGTNPSRCGACHGAPPNTPKHTPNMTLHDCASCHSTVDASGNIINRPDGGNTHINGVIDGP